MRVLIGTTGYAGHHLPLVPLARALKRAGHNVLFAGPASRTGIVEGSGMTIRAIDDIPDGELDRVIASVAHRSPEDAHVDVVTHGFVGVGTRAYLPGMLDAVELWRPDVVLRESLEWGSALAAERHGIPHARIALGLTTTEEQIHEAIAAPLSKLREEVGLEPDRDGAWIAREPWFTAVPEELDIAHPDVFADPIRYRAPTPATTPLPAWWGGSTMPLVYISFGSVAGKIALFPALYQQAIAAIAPLPVRVLVTIGQADPAELGPLPANVHVERWVPQEDVLPHASAVVGHGGYGTTLGALAAGVPQVAIPLFSGDQWVNARRIAELGAGIALSDSGPERTVFALPSRDVMGALRRSVICSIGAPLYRRVAGRIAMAMRALPDAADVVADIEAIAAAQPSALIGEDRAARAAA